MSGSLESLLNNPAAALDGDVLMSVVKDVVRGVEFLHLAKPRAILHCDLKASNILLTESFTAKIADFGLSMKWDALGIPGSPTYMAPELARGTPSH